MAEFLLELFSEEIPARMQKQAADDLKRLFCAGLDAAGLAYTSAEAHVTPRRLALVVDGLPLRQPDRVEERKGPKVGAPQPAIDGFLKAAGLSSLDEAEQRDTGKGMAWFAVTSQPGQPTEDVLESILVDVISRFPWPKSMRWSAHSLNWVRPLHSILMVFDGKPIDATLEIGPTLTYRVGNTTMGHRFLAPKPFEVQDFADYKARLREHNVILDREERKAEIARQLFEAATTAGLEVVPDPGLLDEVTGLVEWPHVLLGRIDDDFMTLPREVRTATMRANQKYFSLRTPGGSGAPAPRFAIVANIPGADGGRAIIAGNERVLRARLSDARFFWDQDLKISFDSRLDALKAVTFHAELGNMWEKAERISKLAGQLAIHITGCDANLAKLAGRYAKADLVSGMVGEFPELQGVVGMHYAAEQLNFGSQFDFAIADHYRPLGPTDVLPSNPIGTAVALADKLDTLVGFFAIGELPTGSRDPYALRRAALGIIRLITENNLYAPLLPLIARAAELHDKTVDATGILGFITDRLKVALRDRGIRYDYIEAVIGHASGDDLLRIVLRVRALESLLQTKDGAALLAGYKRAANIVAAEGKKDGVSFKGLFRDELLTEPAERELGDDLKASLAESRRLVSADRFEAAMTLLAQMRPPIDRFFDEVRVNDPNPELRHNRLEMLTALIQTFDAIADFSKIEG